jgi:hypothetical protein
VIALRTHLRSERSTVEAHDRAGGERDQVESLDDLALLGPFPPDQHTSRADIVCLYRHEPLPRRKSSQDLLVTQMIRTWIPRVKTLASV